MEWPISNKKAVTIRGSGHRVVFKWIGKYNRYVSVSREVFDAMDDVSITSGMRLKLNNNVELVNYGTVIRLIKFCTSRDGKQCEGGFLNFSPSEWQYFWIELRPKIYSWMK